MSSAQIPSTSWLVQFLPEALLSLQTLFLFYLHFSAFLLLKGRFILHHYKKCLPPTESLPPLLSLLITKGRFILHHYKKCLPPTESLSQVFYFLGLSNISFSPNNPINTVFKLWWCFGLFPPIPFPSSGGSSNPGIELWSLALQADSLPSEQPGNSNTQNLRMWLYLEVRSLER